MNNRGPQISSRLSLTTQNDNKKIGKNSHNTSSPLRRKIRSTSIWKIQNISSLLWRTTRYTNVNTKHISFIVEKIPIQKYIILLRRTNRSQIVLLISVVTHNPIPHNNTNPLQRATRSHISNIFFVAACNLSININIDSYETFQQQARGNSLRNTK